MVGFFDTEPEGDEPPQPGPPERLYAPSGPAWLNSPEQYFRPALLPWSKELGRSVDVVVALSGVKVWPDSCTLDLMIFSQRSIRHLPGGPFGLGHPMAGAPERGGLRIGVLFADGRRGTSQDRASWWPPEPGLDAATASPVLRQGGGGGGQFHFETTIRLWPLPPDGPLTLVVDWQARGIDETRTEVDGSALRAAAGSAVEIWSDLLPRPAGGGPHLEWRHAGLSGGHGAAIARRVQPPPEPDEA